MYRRPKFLEKLLQIRREMALEADYDVDLFAELVRSGLRSNAERPAAINRGNEVIETPAQKIISVNGVLPK